MSADLVLQFEADERFRVELLRNAAPRTCAALLAALPIVRDDARHPMYSGLAVYTMVDFNIDVVENPYMMGAEPGDLLYHANPLRSMVADARLHANEIYVPYGPLMVWDWAGPTPLNRFGRIVDADLDLERLAVIGRRFREGGFQRMSLLPVEGADGD